MNDIMLINILIVIKLIELIVEYSLLAYLGYIFIKPLTWAGIKKEFHEYVPILSVVFISSFLIQYVVYSVLGMI